MISFQKNDTYSNEAAIIVAKDGSYAVLLAGETATSTALLINTAPSVRSIRYNSCLERIEADYQPIAKLLDDEALTIIDLSKFNNLVKQIKALLTNIGYPILNIYGFKISGNLYMYDMGYELKLSEISSVYVDFALISNNGAYGLPEFGYDFINKQCISDYSRSTGTYRNGVYEFLPSKVPFVASQILPGVTLKNISFTPSLDIVISGIYSSLPENSFRVLEMTKEGLCTCAGGALVSSKEIATELRAKGADVMKLVATNLKAQEGLSKVASAKIASADVIDSLGDMLLVQTAKTGLIESKMNYEDSRFEFLQKACPDADCSLGLLFNANNTINMLGSAKVIDYTTMQELLENLIGQQPSWNSNANLHMIYNEAGELIGFLPAGDHKVVFENLDTVEQECFDYIEVEDDLLAKDELTNIAIDDLNHDAAKAELQCSIDDTLVNMAAIDLTHIRKEIKSVDELVSKNFNSLSSLLASSDNFAAIAATRLKAVELILTFPMKTAYSAIEFGLLAEFFDISSNPDGTSNVEIRQGLYVPYLPRQTERQCGRDWVILESDPGTDYNNDILIGPTRASLFNDLDSLKLSPERKAYYITKRQTRGSGKSEQEVVPERKTEERVVCNLNNFLLQVKNILLSILNHESMVACTLIKESINKISTAITRYNNLRKPYQEQLLQYFANQQRLFTLNHMIQMIDNRFNYRTGLARSSNISFKKVPVEDMQSFNLTNFQVGFVNSIMSGFVVKDKYLEDTSYKQQVDDINAKVQQEFLKFKNCIVALLGSDIRFTCTKDSMSIGVGIGLSNLSIDDTMSKASFRIDPDEHATNQYYIVIDAEHNHLERTSALEKLRDESFQTIIQKANESINALHRNYLESIASLKQALDEVLSQPPEIYFNGEKMIVSEDGLIVIEVGTKQAIFKVTKDSVDSRQIMTIKPERIVIPEDQTTLPPIAVGSITYDVINYLKHNYIFGNCPYSETIRKKISYALLGTTNGSSSKMGIALKKYYGQAAANYLSTWLSKSSSANVATMASCLAYAAIGSVELFVTTIMAFQDTTLLQLLEKNKFSRSNLSVYDSVVTSLSI